MTISKRILEILSKKKAISVEEVANDISLKSTGKAPEKAKYALKRAINDLEKGGFLEYLEGAQNQFVRLTQKGHSKARSQKLDTSRSLLSPSWDGKWRIILLDLPESRKDERESLRYLLKKAGFVCLKNSVWVSIYPFEHLFTNIKNDLGLTSELMILVTNELDPETEKFFFENFK